MSNRKILKIVWLRFNKPWGYKRLIWLLAAWLLCVASSSFAAAAEQQVNPELRDALRAAAKQADSFDNRFAAEVWLADMSSRLGQQMPDEHERLALLKLVHAEATRAGLSPNRVLAVIEVESNFQRFAISRVGARGLMQIMPFWTAEIGHPDDNLFDPQTNLRYGCTILKFYLDMERGDMTRALARYNGSLGRLTYPNLVNRALRNHWYEQ